MKLLPWALLLSTAIHLVGCKPNEDKVSLQANHLVACEGTPVAVVEQTLTGKPDRLVQARNLVDVGVVWLLPVVDTNYRVHEIDSATVYRWREFLVSRILVIRKSDHEIIQTIMPEVEPCEELRCGGPLQREDINFDGYPDFRLRLHNYMYSSLDAFYVFDPKDTTFNRVGLLDGEENVEVFPHLRALHSGSHSGPMVFYHSLFQWQGDKLIKVGEETWDDIESPVHYIGGLGPNGWQDHELFPDREYPAGNLIYGTDSTVHMIAPYDYVSPGRLIQFLR